MLHSTMPLTGIKIFLCKFKKQNMHKQIHLSLIATALFAFLLTSSRATPVDSIPTVFKNSLQKIFDTYLHLKDALVKGNTKEAGNEASAMNTIAAKISGEGLSKSQSKMYRKEIGKILHHSEHIRDNT